MSYRALDNLLQDSKGGITSFPFLLTITDQGMEKPQTQHLCVFFFFFHQSCRRPDGPIWKP